MKIPNADPCYKLLLITSMIVCVRTIYAKAPFRPEGNPGGIGFTGTEDHYLDVRGWLQSINNPTLSNGPNNDDSSDLFGMELIYNGLLNE